MKAPRTQMPAAVESVGESESQSESQLVVSENACWGLLPSAASGWATFSEKQKKC